MECVLLHESVKLSERFAKLHARVARVFVWSSIKNNGLVECEILQDSVNFFRYFCNITHPKSGLFCMEFQTKSRISIVCD